MYIIWVHRTVHTPHMRVVIRVGRQLAQFATPFILLLFLLRDRLGIFASLLVRRWALPHVRGVTPQYT